ncbi:hypothetical protein [Streptomyces umbrinus]|uniref:hypothetical protein n=1 Tax=Streptomyces umbrinus TaxID=67370 RepID=UPI003C30C056
MTCREGLVERQSGYGERVSLRFDGHLLHVVHNGLLAKTLATPIPADKRAKLHGARIADTELPPTAKGFDAPRG